MFFYSIAFVAVRKAFVYECCPAVYPFVLFTIQIRRRTLYYVVNVVGKFISENNSRDFLNKLYLSINDI